MIWNRKCNEVRKLLALAAGNDLDDQGQAEARRHAAVCPHCREYAVHVQSGHQALEEVRLAMSEAPAVASVWPNVQRSLRTVQPMAAPVFWERWLPVTAVAAACFAAMVIMELPPFRGPGERLAERDNLWIPTVVTAPPWEAGGIREHVLPFENAPRRRTVVEPPREVRSPSDNGGADADNDSR